MKKLVYILLAMSFSLCACEKLEKKTAFKVRGNCDMCKERIEQTALSVKGVLDARWNVETGILQLMYDSTKVAPAAVHAAIAQEGHGTSLMEMDMKAHSALPECCQVKSDQTASCGKEGCASSKPCGMQCKGQMSKSCCKKI